MMSLNFLAGMIGEACGSSKRHDAMSGAMGELQAAGYRRDPRDLSRWINITKKKYAKIMPEDGRFYIAYLGSY